MVDPFAVCENLLKIYRVGETEVMALQGLDLEIARGELLALIGPSGSGKSTLLSILGGLDRPTAGSVVVEGRSLLKMTDPELDHYRRSRVGFVWQQSARNLISYLTALENVELPILLAGRSATARIARARELLAAVGLEHRRGHRLDQLSGGEQQRVAVAVALANEPALLLGDEPTGELDSATALSILELLRTLNERYRLTTVLVTHDPQVAATVDRVVTIRDGKTSNERVRQGESGGADGDAGFRDLVVLDSAGRLQIPPEIREDLRIGDRAALERVESGILIRPVGTAAWRPREADLELAEEEGFRTASNRRRRVEKRARGFLSSLFGRARR